MVNPINQSNRTKAVGQQVTTASEVRSKRRDLSINGGQIVYDGPCLLRGVNINTALNANAVTICDGTTDEGEAKDVIPASMTAGTWIPYGDAYYANGIFLDYADATTGDVSLKIIPLE